MALNIMKALRTQYRVVCVALNGGALLPEFLDECDELVQSPLGIGAPDFHFIVSRIKKRFLPVYCIANSVLTFDIGLNFESAGVPVIGLVHEFSSYSKHLKYIQPALARFQNIIFSAQVVKNSFVHQYGNVVDRAIVTPQGKSTIPGMRRTEAAASDLRGDNEFVVVGAGTIELRKGVDLFVSAAVGFTAKYPDIKAKFVWVGGFPTVDSEFRTFLTEQIDRSALGSRLVVLPPTPDLEAVFQQCDVLFLSSRLDPLPNVGIDAGFVGLPILCFSGATGFAEFLAKDERTSRLVVPHLDISTAVGVLHEIASKRVSMTELGITVEAMARSTFRMDRYVEQIDALMVGER